jgi:hypothetical protein
MEEDANILKNGWKKMLDGSRQEPFFSFEQEHTRELMVLSVPTAQEGRYLGHGYF